MWGLEHFRAVRGCERTLQAQLLRRAAKERWSREKLKRVVRSYQGDRPSVLGHRQTNPLLSLVAALDQAEEHAAHLELEDLREDELRAVRAKLYRIGQHCAASAPR